jgi:hypothetical protein
MMRIFEEKLARMSGIFIVLGVLSACSQGANPSGMIAMSAIEPLQSDSNLRERVSIGSVSGGQGTNPLWISEVSNDDFASALRQSLAANALLAIRNEAFRVDASLIGFDRPLAGLDLTVTARIRYKLTRVADSEVLYDREIRAPFTANFGSAFLANERLKLANEGAVKENIRQFLRDLVVQAQSFPRNPNSNSRDPTARPTS